MLELSGCCGCLVWVYFVLVYNCYLVVELFVVVLVVYCFVLCLFGFGLVCRFGLFVLIVLCWFASRFTLSYSFYWLLAVVGLVLLIKYVCVLGCWLWLLLFGLGVLLVWIFVVVVFVKIILLCFCWVVLLTLVSLDNLFACFVCLIDLFCFDCWLGLFWLHLFDLEFVVRCWFLLVCADLLGSVSWCIVYYLCGLVMLCVWYGLVVSFWFWVCLLLVITCSWLSVCWLGCFSLICFIWCLLICMFVCVLVGAVGVGTAVGLFVLIVLFGCLIFRWIELLLGRYGSLLIAVLLLDFTFYLFCIMLVALV